tara:strand:+ start:1099 stop:1323 length:225 start_codon:yes stop_codon:yes gene_type:complete
MSNKETIKFSISQDGNVTQEVYNVFGSACVDLTKDIEIKLGDLENRVYSTEYYQQPLNLDQDITIDTKDYDVSF